MTEESSEVFGRWWRMSLYDIHGLVTSEDEEGGFDWCFLYSIGFCLDFVGPRKKENLSNDSNRLPDSFKAIEHGG